MMIKGMRGAAAACALSFVGIAACADGLPTQATADAPPELAGLIGIPCTASVSAKRVDCGTIMLPRMNTSGLASVEARRIVGGQNQFVRLTSSNLQYDTGTDIFSFDVTVQNLMNETLGAFADGTVADPDGIMVFFQQDPVSMDGPGVLDVANNDGTAFFLRAGQKYYQYFEVLDKDEVSAPKTWQISIPDGVDQFEFSVYVQSAMSQELVINEFLVNPGGTITDANGEWFEIYNAGTFPVEMQDLVLADSAASGRRPFHRIPSSLIVPAGGYVVLGNTTNTTNNGGVPVDYAYVNALQFANSLDAMKIALVVGTDTLTIDRTQYSSPGVSAQNGISRELVNPALDNSNMDGSNWADATVTAVYGPGGRGTPKAQNSTFTPVMLASPAGLRARIPERIGTEPPTLRPRRD